MYISRYLETAIKQAHQTFKVVYVSGPRQVGKTTVLQHLAKQYRLRYVSLDNLADRQLAQSDPGLFLQQYQAPLFIDEVQYAPQLFSEIKLRVDQHSATGQYWLTGSQQFAMIKNVQESLTGRVAIVNLLGFSTAEILRLKKPTEPFTLTRQLPSTYPWSATNHSIFERIHRGSFPALWQNRPPNPTTFFNAYIQTYIDRDLRVLYGIEKTREFHVFLQLCAARTGQWLNYSDLARDAAVSVPTAKDWLSILEQTMLVWLLRPYHTNRIKRLIKAPKLYFLDTGLAAFLTKWRSPDTLAQGAMAGAFFETFVVSEIVKSYLFRGEDPPLYGFRDGQGREIDLIIVQNETLTPIEIKRAVYSTTADAKQIQFLQNKLPSVGIGGIICLTKHLTKLNSTTILAPVGLIS
ncbi:MAG: ATP-binding protein [Candidatus Kerfeldbacteria bacterium]|nr:ATP-binding protein [Candidatus Kerfeldbacteria bacterium]